MAGWTRGLDLEGRKFLDWELCIAGPMVDRGTYVPWMRSPLLRWGRSQ